MVGLRKDYLNYIKLNILNGMLINVLKKQRLYIELNRLNRNMYNNTDKFFKHTYSPFHLTHYLKMVT